MSRSFEEVMKELNASPLFGNQAPLFVELDNARKSEIEEARALVGPLLLAILPHCRPDEVPVEAFHRLVVELEGARTLKEAAFAALEVPAAAVDDNEEHRRINVPVPGHSVEPNTLQVKVVAAVDPHLCGHEVWTVGMQTAPCVLKAGHLDPCKA